MKQITIRLNELQKEYKEVISKLQEAWDKIYPQLRESYERIVKAYISILDSLANVAISYLKALLTLINEHQKELKEIAVMASELAQDIAKIVFKAVGQIRKDVDEFAVLLINQVKALPIYDLVKEQYKDIINLQVPESILASVHELSEIIKSMLPTEELRQFFSATYEYIIKHVKHEKVGFPPISYIILPFRLIASSKRDLNNKVIKIMRCILVSRRSTMPTRSKRSISVRSTLSRPSSSF